MTYLELVRVYKMDLKNFCSADFVNIKEYYLKNVLIFGERNTGKTHLLQQFLNFYLPTHEVHVIDTLCEEGEKSIINRLNPTFLSNLLHSLYLHDLSFYVERRNENKDKKKYTDLIIKQLSSVLNDLPEKVVILADEIEFSLEHLPLLQDKYLILAEHQLYKTESVFSMFDRIILLNGNNKM